MARNTQLPDGQLQLAAQPVNAFINPKQRNVSQPNQLPTLGAPKGINTISTAGTPQVQTQNNLSVLAEKLVPFNKNLISALQAGGIAYAAGEIEKGEAQARNQVMKALALNDASMERDELTRAAENRALAIQDPQAGQMMAFLNPYQKIGFERGLAKAAAQEVQVGLPAYVAANGSKIDYLAPDQGFGALAGLQAEYTAKVAQRYGLTPSSPGFQRYTLPALEKAQDKLNTQHVADRKKFFDKASVGQGATQLEGLYRSSVASGQVEWQGRVYRRADSESAFNIALQLRGQEIVQRTVLSSSLPGEASERSLKIFQTLAASADYQGDQQFRNFINSIPGNEPERGADGKAVVDPRTGQPVMMRWGDLYGVQSIDTEIKYGQAGYQSRKREREMAIEEPGGFEDGLMRATAGMPIGPERAAAADQFTANFYREQAAKGVPVSLADLQKRQKQLMDVSSELYVAGGDPNVASDYYADLERRRGSAFDPIAERRRIDQLSLEIRDPRQREAFVKEANRRVSSKEEEQARFKEYDRSRDQVIEDNIKSLLDRNYGPQTDRNKVNRTEARRRMELGLTTYANEQLLKEEAKLGRRLTDSEVRTITQRAVTEYGTKGAEEGGKKSSTRDYLFPGGKFSNEPSVRPQDVQVDRQPKGADGKPKEQIQGGQYRVVDLDYIPDRKVLLRNYRDKPILSQPAVLQLIDSVAGVKPLNAREKKALDRAWRDAGAKNAGEFILEQADFYDIELPPQLRRDLQRASAQERGAEDMPVAYERTAQERPLLATVGNWALNALTGSAPATAGTLDAAPGGRNGALLPAAPARSATPVRTATPQPAAGRGVEVAPPAPVLPPPPQEIASARVAPAPAPAAQPQQQQLATANDPLLVAPTRQGPTFADRNRLIRSSSSGGLTIATASRLGGTSLPDGASYSSSDPRGQSLIAMATRNGWDPADLAAIFSFETGGTLDPNQPGYGAAAGRIGLIQAGPNERAAYGLGSGNWSSEMAAVERYLIDRGAKPGMGLEDLYATVNGGNPGAGYKADGNGTVARSNSTLRQLREHREQATRRLGLTRSAASPAGGSTAFQPLRSPRSIRASEIGSGFGAHESFRRKPHEGVDVRLNQGTPLGLTVPVTVVGVYPTNSTAGEANGGYGSFVDLRLPNGNIVRWSHLSEIAGGLKKGMRINPGQLIARIGGAKGTAGAGRSTGPHLHMELLKGEMGTQETTRGKLDPVTNGATSLLLIGS